MKQRQMKVVAGVVLIVLIVLFALTYQPAGAISALATPTPQHVQLEPGGTVYILGDCHLSVDVNGSESLQVSCEAESNK